MEVAGRWRLGRLWFPTHAANGAAWMGHPVSIEVWDRDARGATGGKASIEKEFFPAVVVAVAGKVEKRRETAWILAKSWVQVFQNGTVELRRKGKVR